MAMITPDEAQALQHAAAAGDVWLMWFVSLSDPTYPGKAVAWAIIADFNSGTRSPGLLVADTLKELCGMLPAGPTRQGWTGLMPAGRRHGADNGGDDESSADRSAYSGGVLGLGPAQPARGSCA